MLLIFCATFAAYFPALGGGLVWDDNGHVTKPELQPLHGLWRIWFEVGATQQYYPVLHSAFWIEHRLWGDGTVGYHIVNVLLHATAACLFVTLLRRLFRTTGSNPPTSFLDAPLLGGLIFALHPVCVESVAWISEQKNTLSAVFYLLSALTYLGWRESLTRVEERVGTGVPPVHGIPEGSGRTDGRTARPCLWPSWIPYFIALFLFILALLSKSVTATLPAALLVVCWWQQGRLSWRRDVVPLLPWFALGAAAGLFTAWVEHRYIGAQGSEFALTGIERCLLVGRIVCFYLGKLLWPAGLSFIYPHWQLDATSAGSYLYPIAVLALLAGAWAIRGRSRAPLAAMLFFVGSLFPALGFIDVYPFRYSYVADHFQYLPSVGIIALAAAGWERWRAEERGRGRGAATRGAGLAGAGAVSMPTLPNLAAILVLAVLGVLAWRQSWNYVDGDTLYRATLARNPGSWLAHNNLANDLMMSGHLDEAIEHYRQAQRLEPGFPEACDNLGIALGRAGRSEEAVAIFQEALRLRPDYAEAHYNLAVVLAQMGRLPEAIDHYGTARQLSPNHSEVHLGLGMALARTGRYAEAIDEFQRAAALRPDDASAYGNLGTLFRMMGRNEEAIRTLEHALRLQPDLAAAHYNLSLALRAEGRVDAAAAEMAEAVRLNSAGEAR
jgi:tetratricopeptide (TPR) repeat protein